MKSTVVDADGTVRCPECGATSFRSQRSPENMAALGIFVAPAAALFSPKRLKCDGCGTYLRAGENTLSVAGTRTKAPHGYATDNIDLGDEAVQGYGCRVRLDEHALTATFSRMQRFASNYPAAIKVPLRDVLDVRWQPPSMSYNGTLTVSCVNEQIIEMLFSYEQREQGAALADRVTAAVTQPDTPPVPDAPSAAPTGLAERLAEIDRLCNDGVITSEERSMMRERILITHADSES